MNTPAFPIRPKFGSAIAVIFVLLTTLVLWLMPPSHWLHSFTVWQPEQIKAIILSWGSWGPIAYIALLISSVVISQIPGAPLAILAGTIWTPFWAAIFTLIGGFAGAAIAYSLGRTFGTPLIRYITGKDFQFEPETSQRKLGGFIFLARLFPIIPFDLLSYGAGASRISWPLYATTTLCGMVPSTFLLAYGTTFDFSALLGH